MEKCYSRFTLIAAYLADQAILYKYRLLLLLFLLFEKENQILLNCFTRWCQWANFVIRVDKCVTFGVKKYSTRSTQFQPKLLIDKQLVPPVKNGESFKYLGRYFDFDMTNELHKSKLLSLSPLS